METFNKTLDEGQAGDDVGLLLRGVTRAEVRGGTIVCAPGSIESVKLFQVYISTLCIIYIPGKHCVQSRSIYDLRHNRGNNIIFKPPRPL